MESRLRIRAAQFLVTPPMVRAQLGAVYGDPPIIRRRASRARRDPPVNRGVRPVALSVVDRLQPAGYAGSRDTLEKLWVARHRARNVFVGARSRRQRVSA